jgi:hypothetical protein
MLHKEKPDNEKQKPDTLLHRHMSPPTRASRNAVSHTTYSAGKNVPLPISSQIAIVVQAASLHTYS